MIGSPDAGHRPPPLHAITDDRILAAPGFIEAAEELLEACGPRLALHLRGPGTSGRELHAAAVRLVPAARRAGARLVVNGRVDVAIAAGADAVQLPSRGLTPAIGRRLLGPAALIGASVHSESEGREAVGAGADYLLAGTLFESASHPGRSPIGAGLIRALAPLGVPVIGIGGITADRVAEVLFAGAAGVAVRGAVWAAERPAAAAAGILITLDDRVA